MNRKAFLLWFWGFSGAWAVALALVLAFGLPLWVPAPLAVLSLWVFALRLRKVREVNERHRQTYGKPML